MNRERLITLSLIILAAAVSRILPHPVNVTPIAALALFAGAQFERRWLAFAVPMLAMFLSDAVIGFYSQMWVTYVAFAVIVCLGFALRGRISPLPVVGTVLAGSVLFFLISNCALVMHGELYPANFEGMMASYTAALPFFRNTLLGDMFYAALLFGGFALAERKYSWLRLPQAA